MIQEKLLQKYDQREMKDNKYYFEDDYFQV